MVSITCLKAIRDTDGIDREMFLCIDSGLQKPGASQYLDNLMIGKEVNIFVKKYDCL